MKNQKKEVSITNTDIEDEPEDKELYELADDFLENSELSHEIPYGYYAEEIAIGKCPSKQREDETLYEFKKSIADELTKIGLDTKIEEINLVSDCWMDN